ncbi:MAG: type III-B CRISPR module-associated protein Cmr3 [Ktedonobacteraceae bacterium]|nr:type III-B CRISPR module-associated protein Cmr3 [Ktedonobacteraceae bacterium]
MRIFIEPIEPLLFRTGRPFDAGESGYAETLFPPTPETLQGAIRATIATHWDRTKTLESLFSHDELVNLIGNRESYGRFRITGLTLGRRTANKKIERLFPAPAHLLQVQDEQGKKPQICLVPDRKPELISDLPDGAYYLFPDHKPDSKLEPLNYWLTERGLHKMLHTHDTLLQEDIVKEHQIYTLEPRLGIGMDNAAKTTREGLLYQTQMVRMSHGYGFVVDIRLSTSPESTDLIDDDKTQQLLRLPESGRMTMGGERRTASFEIISDSASTQTLEHKRQGNLLYLATPAAFTNGWQPNIWQAPLLPPIAAAINRYQPIGGWYLNPQNAGGSNKTMRRCVPAGSVYFFDQTITVMRPLTEYGWQIGYGITYTGDWRR